MPSMSFDLIDNNDNDHSVLQTDEFLENIDLEEVLDFYRMN